MFKKLNTNTPVSTFGLILIGDGSGTTYDKPGGSACIAVSLEHACVFKHFCAFSGATNNFCELIPYIHALWHYQQFLAKNNFVNSNNKVLIISDSEITVKAGQKIFARNALSPLWAAIDNFEQSWYHLSWKWQPRCSNEFLSYADKMAGENRISIKCLKEHIEDEVLFKYVEDAPSAEFWAKLTALLLEV